MIDVQHIARLANLKLNKNEEKKFSEQLLRIFGYFEKISELNTKGVESKGQVTVKENRFREDEVDTARMLSQEAALGQAKKTHNGYFVVKAVLDTL